MIALSEWDIFVIGVGLNVLALLAWLRLSLQCWMLKTRTAEHARLVEEHEKKLNNLQAEREDRDRLVEEEKEKLNAHRNDLWTEWANFNYQNVVAEEEKLKHLQAEREDRNRLITEEKEKLNAYGNDLWTEWATFNYQNLATEEETQKASKKLAAVEIELEKKQMFLKNTTKTFNGLVCDYYCERVKLEQEVVKLEDTIQSIDHLFERLKRTAKEIKQPVKRPRDEQCILATCCPDKSITFLVESLGISDDEFEVPIKRHRQ